MAGKRSTERGMGEAGSQKASRASRRGPPLSCPGPRVPQVEDVSAKTRARRSTIGRDDSPSDAPRSDPAAAREPALPTGTPRVTPKAASLKGLALQPRDAFILSRIDGGLDASDLADLTGLPARDVLATLERLSSLGLITIS
jgi:hypothetical protein